MCAHRHRPLRGYAAALINISYYYICGAFRSSRVASPSRRDKEIKKRVSGTRTCRAASQKLKHFKYVYYAIVRRFKMNKHAFAGCGIFLKHNFSASQNKSNKARENVRNLCDCTIIASALYCVVSNFHF